MVPNGSISGAPSSAKAEVFISHISEEAGVAGKLKEVIGQDFLDMLEVFAPSDSESIAAGEDWPRSIDESCRARRRRSRTPRMWVSWTATVQSRRG